MTELEELRHRVEQLEGQRGNQTRERKPSAARWTPHSSTKIDVLAKMGRRQQHGDALRLARVREGISWNAMTELCGLLTNQLQTLEGGGGSINALFRYAKSLNLSVEIVCHLSKLEGMTTADIVKATGLSVDTVKAVVSFLASKKKKDSLLHVDSVVRVLSVVDGFISVE